MKAIQTKYLGPTNTKPARIKASAEGVKSIVCSKDELENALESDGVSALDIRNVHQLAAKRFRDRYGWTGELTQGCLPNGDWAHCFVPPTAR